MGVGWVGLGQGLFRTAVPTVGALACATRLGGGFMAVRSQGLPDC